VRVRVALTVFVITVLASTASADAAEELRGAISLRHPSVQWVDGATLARWMDDGPSVVLLDARAEGEYRVSHLRGARRVDPDREDGSGLEIARGARVVVYCSVGWRSAGIAERLARAGVRDVYNLHGGIISWANAGRPVVRGDAVVRAVHPYDAVWGRMLDARLHAYRP
jgi:rhodanese-related sulfurtransferase